MARMLIVISTHCYYQLIVIINSLLLSTHCYYQLIVITNSLLLSTHCYYQLQEAQLHLLPEMIKENNTSSKSSSSSSLVFCPRVDSWHQLPPPLSVPSHLLHFHIT